MLGYNDAIAEQDLAPWRPYPDFLIKTVSMFCIRFSELDKVCASRLISGALESDKLLAMESSYDDISAECREGRRISEIRNFKI